MAQRIHFIDINDPIACDLALALQQQGYQVLSSAASITKPIQNKLIQANLLPQELGWFPKKLTSKLNQVIVSRTLPANNPELQVALELGIPVSSYSEYIYTRSADKQRIVFTGGLETNYIYLLTAHVLHYWHRQFDYVWQQPIPSWKTSVQLTDAPIILLQADALPTSVLNNKPQFLTYQHNILVLSGLIEERGKAYATIDDTLKALETLADATPKGGVLIYNQAIPLLKKLGAKNRTDVKALTYQTLDYYTKKDQAYLKTPQGAVPIAYTDGITLQAMAAAQVLAENLGVDEERFYQAIPSFSMD
jgi:UDP-N-acetylmuramate: L-alanyl-gamma-D-glutamyl-meso-diaminopimelate ligase